MEKTKSTQKRLPDKVVRPENSAPVPELALKSIKSLDRALDPGFLEYLAVQSGAAVFVETGTFYGETTASAAKIFSEVHSIELSPELHSRAEKRFCDQPHVHIHQGESAETLRQLLPKIQSPAIIWLDAHYSEGNTACGKRNTPIIEELGAIRETGIDKVLILIDDLRCFQIEREDTRDSLRGYPTVNQIRRTILDIDSNATFAVVGDVALAAIRGLDFECSDMLKACTISRTFWDGADIDAVFAAERYIYACDSPERDVLRDLAEDFSASEQYGLGGHYRLWRGLLLASERSFDAASGDFAKALELGCDHWRVKWYLAQANMGNAAIEEARFMLKQVLAEAPEFAPAKRCLRTIECTDGKVPDATGGKTPVGATGEQYAITRCIKPGAVVFDVGANVGDWTRAAIQHSPDINVHLFEASPLTFTELQASLAGKSNGHLIFNNIALGNRSGKKSFYHYSDAPAWSTFYRRFEAERLYDKSPPEEITVSVSTLDGYCATNAIGRIDYLKIDVEGAEHDVLLGATTLLKKGAIDYIQFEYGGTYSDAGTTLRLVYSLLKRSGYEIFKIEKDGFTRIPAFNPTLETFEYSNYLGVHERLLTLFAGGKPKMLDLPALFDRHAIAPRGVIHIGAHEGREASEYTAMGIREMVFIEANPKVFERLEHNLGGRNGIHLCNCAVSDRNETVTLYVTSMDQSSSILPLAKHAEIYPEIVEETKIEVPGKTLDCIIEELDLDVEGLNILSLDIQGAELLALRGAEKTLAHIDAINTEINYDELYKGGVHIDELDAFLDRQGFTRVATTTPFHPTWGDALYIRKPVVSMSSLGCNGRFANQIFQYAFLKIYARQHGFHAATPDWVGRKLFGADDAYSYGHRLPEVRQTTQELVSCEIANAEKPMAGIDFWGYFQYHTRFYAAEKDYFKRLFRPEKRIRNALDAAVKRLKRGGRTLVGIHLRRGDYGYRMFFVTPSQWYRRWLEEIWGSLDDPVLYIASDELDEVLEDFADFNPVTSRELGVSIDGAEYYPDFYLMSQCDYVAISNSSYSFAATMLNETGRMFVRPDLEAGELVEYDPWDGEPLLRYAMAEDYGPPYLVPENSDVFSVEPAEGDKGYAGVSVKDEFVNEKRNTIGSRVSVYITSYNQKAWLQQAIDSVLAQTVRPHEIIIVDDCSSDGSQALIQSYAEGHPELVKTIFHRDNQGISKTRIDALEAVTGDYVTYVDGDDRILPEKIERELGIFKDNPEAEIVYSNFYFIDENGIRTGSWAEEADSVPVGQIFAQVFARDFPKRTLFRNELVSVEALKRVGFHDPELKLFEDFDLRIRMAQSMQAAYCDTPLAEYRLHSGGLSRTGLLEHVAALDYIFNKNIALQSVLAAAERTYVTRRYQDWVTETFLAGAEQQLVTERGSEDRIADSGCGKNLVFLMSLPGSGSTLLQKILDRHSGIKAAGGHWLMLHFAYALRQHGISAEYDENLARQGLEDFLTQYPEGEDGYLKAAGHMTSRLYQKALAMSGKQIFVDNTPRNIHIVAELARTFPKAKFVFLLRNPAAVFDSTAATWFDGKVDAIKGTARHEDLYEGPARLREGMLALGTDAIILRYEDLVSSPNTVMRRLCVRLHIPFEAGMLDYGVNPCSPDPDSCPTTVERPIKALRDDRDVWLGRLAVSGNLGYARSYIQSLGQDTVEGLGYGYREILEQFALAESAVRAQALPANKENAKIARNAVLRGETCYARGDINGAVAAFKLALETDPGCTTALNNLAVVAWDHGDQDTALESVQLAFERDPSQRSTVFNYADMLLATERYGEAKEALALYCGLFPDDAEAGMRLSELNCLTQSSAPSFS